MSSDLDKSKVTILLGGLGGDSHSVGLTILRNALLFLDYNVLYLGTQNSIEEFFENAAGCDAVMISTMDGHAKKYLDKFPELLREHKLSNTFWYLGGNLSVNDGIGFENFFLEMGFHRVFVWFSSVSIGFHRALARQVLGLRLGWLAQT